MVEQIPGTLCWRSDLLRGVIFESREEAEHYTREEEAKLNAAAQRSDEELLSKLSPQALKNLAAAFMGHVALNTQETRDYCDREFDLFTAAHPRFIISDENARRLAACLIGRGYNPPYNSQQYADAYSLLAPQGQIDLTR